MVLRAGFKTGSMEVFLDHILNRLVFGAGPKSVWWVVDVPP